MRNLLATIYVIFWASVFAWAYILDGSNEEVQNETH